MARNKGFYCVLEYHSDTSMGNYFTVAAVKLDNARACVQWIKKNGQDGCTYIGAKMVTKVQNVRHERLTKTVVTDGPEVGAVNEPDA